MSDSLRGKYLVAGKRLRDGNFYKTVVLLIEDGDEGSMGLIINRPSSVTVAHALSEHFDLPETDDLVYAGGPVEPSALFILHTAGELDMVEPPVLPGVYVGSSADAFEQIVRAAVDGDPDLRFRIFSGCAGWAPGQLAGELDRGDWIHLSATAESLFDADPYEIWDVMRDRYGELHNILPSGPLNGPANPEWN